MATPGTECSGEWMLPGERKKGHRNQVWIPAPEGGPRGAAPHPGREPGRSLRLSEERVMRCTFIVGIKNLNQSSRSLARESHEPLSGRITAAQLGGGNGSSCPEPVIRGAKGTIALLRALQPAGSNLKRHRPNAPPQQAARRTPCGTLGASSGTARTACIRAKCVRSSIGDGDRLGPHPLESFSLARRRAACSADGRKVPQKRAAVAALKSSAMVSYIGQIFQITPVPGIWTSEPLPVPTT